MSSHWLALLSLAAALGPRVAAQDNQCFYAASQRAGSIIVPCSSSGTYASCCQLGDLCLSDSACWNPQYNVTYLYGCTDSSYKDFTCPYKCGPTFADAPYVGLDYCSNTTNYEWSCTHPKNSNQAIQPFDYTAQCLNDSIIAFAGPVSLPPYLSLPTSIGGSTLYFSETAGSYIPVTGYTPTTTVQFAASVPTTVEFVGSTSTTPSTSPPPATSSSAYANSPSTSATASSTAPTSTTSIPSSSASASASSSGSGSSPENGASSSSTSSNTGLKVGLGVGITGGVLFLSALILFFLMWRRRRQRHAAIPQHESDDHAYAGAYGARAEKKTTRYQDSPAMGAGAGRLGHQRLPSELAADHVDTYRKPVGSPSMTNSTQRSPVPLYSEFEGSPVPTHTSSAPPQRYEMGDSR